MTERLPQVVLTTLFVAVLPVAAVWTLAGTGTIEGVIPLMLAGAAISLAMSTAGSAYWKRRPNSGDYLFHELTAWGWLRRLWVKRRLDRAVGLLGPRGAEAGDELTLDERRELLESLATALESRDPYTHGHSRRVARHSARIARRMGLPREEVDRIRAAAAIHDIGKLETPREILNKPAGLTDEEFDVVKRHPVDGARMTEALGDPELTGIIRHHHERLDASGYPDRLRGGEIPVGARVIAVADTFDAITSTRSYRPAKPHLTALTILREEAGTKLDADAVRAFCGHYSGFRPAAVWAFLATGPQRLVAALTRGVEAGATGAAKALAAAAAVGGLAAATGPGQAVGDAQDPEVSVTSAFELPPPDRAAAGTASAAGAAQSSRGRADRGGGEQRAPGSGGATSPGGSGAFPTAPAPDLVTPPRLETEDIPLDGAGSGGATGVIPSVPSGGAPPDLPEIDLGDLPGP